MIGERNLDLLNESIPDDYNENPIMEMVYSASRDPQKLNIQGGDTDLGNSRRSN